MSEPSNRFNPKSRIRVFLSSPGDVQPERERCEAIITALNAELEGIQLQLIRWEEGVYRATSTFQDQIVSPGDCDLVVCLFWKRLGTPLPPTYARPDGTPRTGTEYEFEQAVETASSREDTLPDIFVYRKTAPVNFAEERLEQELAEKQALDGFWNKWFQDEEGHFLAAFQKFKLTDEFARLFERHIRSWLEGRRQTDWDIDTKGSPFRGLETFDETHAPVFFGRNRLVSRARARMMRSASLGTGSLFIIGGSGSGKSSLVRAGVVPRFMVADSTSPLISRWRRIVMTPLQLGAKVIRGFAEGLYAHDVLPELAEGDYPSPDELSDLLEANSSQGLKPVIRALDRWAKELAMVEGHEEKPPTGLLVVIDQLEEIFQINSDQRKLLIELLSAIAVADRLWLLTTLRSDFYPALQEEAALIDLKERSSTLDVGAPGPADVRQMIECAARAAGLRLEDDGDRNLAELLENESSGPGALPMLQFALQSLFEKRDQNLLRLADYDRFGGAAGALSNRAEQILSEFGDSGDAALATVLRRLVNVRIDEHSKGAQARPAPISAFGSGSSERRLVSRFLEAHLLVAYGDREEESPQVRVAHESLFERWPRAAAQINIDRHDLQTRAWLETDQLLWQSEVPEKRDGLLLTGRRLEEGRHLVKSWQSDLPRLLRLFVHRSEDAARQQRRRKRGVVAAFMIGLAALAITAALFYLQADYQRDRTAEALVSVEVAAEENQSMLIAAANRSLGSSRRHSDAIDRPKAAAYAAEALRYHASEYGQVHARGLLSGLSRRQADTVDFPKSEIVIAISENAEFFASSYRGMLANRINIRSLCTGSNLQTLRTPYQIGQLSISTDGKWASALDTSNTARVWNLDTGEAGKAIQLEGTVSHMMVSSRDGMLFLFVSKLAEEAFTLEHDKRLVVSHKDEMIALAPSSGAEVFRDNRFNAQVTATAISESGKYLAAGTARGELFVWNTDKLQSPIFQLKLDKRIWRISFSPNEARIAVADGSHQATESALKILETKTGQLLRDPIQHPTHIRELEFTPDGNSIVTSGNDGLLRILYLRKDGSGYKILSTEPVREWAISNDGLRLAGADANHVYLWDMRQINDSMIRKFPAEDLVDIRFSSDDRSLIALGRNNRIRLYDASVGEPIPLPLRDKAPISFATFAPNGSSAITVSENGMVNEWDATTGRLENRLLVGSGDSVSHVLKSQDKSTFILYSFIKGMGVGANFERGNLLGQIPTDDYRYSNSIRSITDISPKGRVALFVGSRDNSDFVDAWSIDLGERAGRYHPEEAKVEYAGFTPSGEQIITVGRRLIQLWDLEPPHQQRQSFLHDNPVVFSRFNWDGSILATGDDGGNIFFWDTTSGDLVGPKLSGGAPVVFAHFVDDKNTLLAITRDDLSLQQPGSGNSLVNKTEMLDGVHIANVSPDREWIITGHHGAKDISIKIWDVRELALVGFPQIVKRRSRNGYYSEINQIEMRPDNKKLLVVLDDGTAHVLDTAFLTAPDSHGLAEALEFISGAYINQTGSVERLSIQELSVHQEAISSSVEEDSWLYRLLQWHRRPQKMSDIAPFFEKAARDYAVDASFWAIEAEHRSNAAPSRWREGVVGEALSLAYDLDPGNAVVLAAMSHFSNDSDRASFLRQMSFKRAERRTEDRKSLKKVFELIDSEESVDKDENMWQK